MNFDAIKRLLADTNKKQLDAISADSGVPLPTLIKIKYGAIKNPRIETVEKLDRCLTLRNFA